MAKIEIRKVEETIGETGAGGDRIETTYQLGGEIDGEFIPFVTKNAGYIDHKVSTSKATSEKDKASKPSTPPADDSSSDE
jgi:hypothetical protein